MRPFIPGPWRSSTLITTQGTEHAATNPLGVNFGGNWILGAALVAILAHVYIVYGFESAGDVGEEVVGAGKTVPRAMISALLVGGLTSFILVGAFILAIPKHGFTAAASFSGGIPTIIDAATGSRLLRDIILVFVCYAFISCGTSVQAAATRVMFSYARDDAVPGSSFLRRVSPKFHTPLACVVVSFIIASLFSLLVPGNARKEHSSSLRYVSCPHQRARHSGFVRRIRYLHLVFDDYDSFVHRPTSGVEANWIIPSRQVGMARQHRRYYLRRTDARKRNLSLRHR